jgi:hypothetical protein
MKLHIDVVGAHARASVEKARRQPRLLSTAPRGRAELPVHHHHIDDRNSAVAAALVL